MFECSVIIYKYTLLNIRAEILKVDYNVVAVDVSGTRQREH